MNILFLNSADTDYCQDILYAGLRKRTDIHLYERPFNRRFHFPVKKYPRNLGYTPGALARQLFARIPWQELDVCVVASCHPTTLKTALEVLPKLAPHTRLVFVDGGDWPEIGGDFTRLDAGPLYQEFLDQRNFDLVFKRELITGKDYPANTIPFPFGFNLERVPAQLPAQKKYEVSFWAVESDPVRTEVLQLLEDRFDCRANGTVRNQNFSKYKRKGAYYLQELAACRIVLNFRGAGWDTLRYWETPAVGAFMISQKPQIEIPDNFRHGSEVVFCKDDLSDLVDLCTYYLTHEEERERIAANGAKWLRQYHSEDARAAYFLMHVKALLPAQ